MSYELKKYPLKLHRTISKGRRSMTGGGGRTPHVSQWSGYLGRQSAAAVAEYTRLGEGCGARRAGAYTATTSSIRQHYTGHRK